MNIKSQTPTIRSYGTPSIYSGANLWFIKNGYWYFKNYDSEQPDKNKGPAATGDFTPDYSATLFTGKGSFQRNLDLLNERINVIHKELSYWDLYRITDSVLTEESFPAVISGLAVGNSAVINCDTFTYNNQRYHRGDVIVKINDSEEIWIKSINAGSFKPIGFSKDNQGLYTLEFEYQEGEGVATTVSGLQIASVGNSIYGYSYEKDNLGTEQFPIEYLGTGTDTLIKPVVKSFILSDNGYEEIVLDDDLIVSSSSTDWVLNLAGKPSDVRIYIQVK